MVIIFVLEHATAKANCSAPAQPAGRHFFPRCDWLSRGNKQNDIRREDVAFIGMSLSRCHIIGRSRTSVRALSTRIVCPDSPGIANFHQRDYGVRIKQEITLRQVSRTCYVISTLQVWV